MITVEGIASGTHVHDIPVLSPDIDPLRLEDMLLEAQVISARFDALTQTAAVLIDLRMSLQLRDANTGILVGLDVQNLDWTARGMSTGEMAWTIAASSMAAPGKRSGGSALEFSIAMWPSPGARLNLQADRICFYVGDVLGLDDTPPELEPGRHRADGWQSWSSTFVGKAVSSRDGSLDREPPR